MKKKPTIGIPQLPKDLRPFVIHPTIVVTKQAGAAILKQMRTGRATKALRDLMRDGD
ncbi:MAG TPA: hypothetical protein VGQ46_06205 [Thermoanaerobaculia bacterium]|jgi:hypothetical protein|nr:hypothetical protein [Thermoanaerobaculia bacterium]